MFTYQNHIISRPDIFLEYLKNICPDYHYKDREQISGKIHKTESYITIVTTEAITVIYENKFQFLWLRTDELKEWIKISEVVNFKDVIELKFGYVQGKINSLETSGEGRYNLFVNFIYAQ